MLCFFLTQMLGSACWVIFYIFTQVLFLFNPNAGFSLLGHFIAELFFST